MNNLEKIKDFFNEYGLIITKDILEIFEIKKYINDNSKELTYEILLYFVKEILEMKLQGIKVKQLLLKSKAPSSISWCSDISILGGNEDYD